MPGGMTVRMLGRRPGRALKMNAPIQPKHDVAYGGYHQTWQADPDGPLTQVGPGTPGGEYLRRFWQPVAIESDLKDVPLALRILGEDLVLYRDLGGRTGLVHRNCPHRRASLEYGVCEVRGLRFWWLKWRRPPSVNRRRTSSM